MVPVDTEQSGQYDCNFYAQIPVDQYQGQELRVVMEDAPEILRRESTFQTSRKRLRILIR